MMSAAAGRMPMADEPSEPRRGEHLPRPLDDERGDEHDGGQLGELARRMTDCPPMMIQRRAPLICDADAGNEHRDEPREHQDRERHGQTAPPDVVDAREHDIASTPRTAQTTWRSNK